MGMDEFKCRMCGACCRIKDGIVRVSDAEIARIAAFLGMGEAEFIERETEVAPDRKSLVLKSCPDGSCAYLTEENLCRINPVKPEKCRTFPFEWTNPDSAEVCPGLARKREANLRSSFSLRLKSAPIRLRSCRRVCGESAADLI